MKRATVTAQGEARGALARLPRPLLRAKGVAVAGTALTVCIHAGYPWWLLLALLLAPDLSIAGYIGGPRLGAACYDAAHTYAAPLVLAAIGVPPTSTPPFKSA